MPPDLNQIHLVQPSHQATVSMTLLLLHHHSQPQSKVDLYMSDKTINYV